MSINLVTYANQTVTPTNDAIIYERAIDQNGIFYGCNVTVTSNTVNITGGYGLVCGREFVINSDSLTVTLAPSGTLQGRLYVRLDLADADAPIQLLTATGNTLPPLEQDDDVNYTNGTWEMELATFTVGVSALSDVVETFETIIGSKPFVDYVVEQDVNNDWYYRKWNSGYYEAWRFYQATGVNITTSSAGTYYAPPKSISLPSFHQEWYQALATNAPTQSSGVFVYELSQSGANMNIDFRAHASTSNASCGVNLYLRGRWK